MPVITPEIAREYAERSHEARRLRTAEQKPAPQIAETVAEGQNPRHARMIARKEEQMDKLDDDIDACNDPKMIHFLTGSRERLFNEWCVLTGTAKPAPKKASAPARQRPPTPDPT